MDMDELEEEETSYERDIREEEERQMDSGDEIEDYKRT